MNATNGIDSRTVITVGQPQNAVTSGHDVKTANGIAIVAAENHAKSAVLLSVRKYERESELQ